MGLSQVTIYKSMPGYMNNKSEDGTTYQVGQTFCLPALKVNEISVVSVRSLTVISPPEGWSATIFRLLFIAFGKTSYKNM